MECFIASTGQHANQHSIGSLQHDTDAVPLRFCGGNAVQKLGKLPTHINNPILSKVNEKLVSQAFVRNMAYCLHCLRMYGLLPAWLIAYKGLGCTDPQLAISHHHQKSLDAGMEIIVQLDFSAVFDRVSHSCLLFKLKPIDVGRALYSICTEFLSDRRQ